MGCCMLAVGPAELPGCTTLKLLLAQCDASDRAASEDRTVCWEPANAVHSTALLKPGARLLVLGGPYSWWNWRSTCSTQPHVSILHSSRGPACRAGSRAASGCWQASGLTSSRSCSGWRLGNQCQPASGAALHRG